MSKNNLSFGCVSVGIERFFSPVDAADFRRLAVARKSKKDMRDTWRISPADIADFRRLAVARKNHPTKTIFDNSWPIDYVEISDSPTRSEVIFDFMIICFLCYHASLF